MIEVKEKSKKMNPCTEYCYLRYGKQYSKECDDECEFASWVQIAKDLQTKLDSIDSALNNLEEEVYRSRNSWDAATCLGKDVTKEISAKYYYEGLQYAYALMNQARHALTSPVPAPISAHPQSVVKIHTSGQGDITVL